MHGRRPSLISQSVRSQGFDGIKVRHISHMEGSAARSTLLPRSCIMRFKADTEFDIRNAILETFNAPPAIAIIAESDMQPTTGMPNS